jgi:hypothetical protein
MCARTLILGVGFSSFLLVAPALASAVCVPTTLMGSYVYTLAGVNAAGFTVSEMGVISVTSTDSQGVGSFTGTGFFSPRGLPPGAEGITGLYQLGQNCFVTFLISERIGSQTRFDTITGFVTDNGLTVLFASISDPTVQLAGLAKRMQ